jgi:hypothetical protein
MPVSAHFVLPVIFLISFNMTSKRQLLSFPFKKMVARKHLDIEPDDLEPATTEAAL